MGFCSPRSTLKCFWATSSLPTGAATLSTWLGGEGGCLVLRLPRAEQRSCQRLRDQAACSPPTSFLALRPLIPASPSRAPPHSFPFSFSGLGGLPVCPLTTACSPCCRRDWCNSFPLPFHALQLTQPSCCPFPQRLSFTRMQFASINYCSSLQ